MDNVQEVKLCSVCAKGCRLREGETGACDKYTIENGQLIETTLHRYLTICPISIETIPILHFYPKGKFLQITTTGCNFDCPGCVSTVFVKEMNKGSLAIQYRTPDEVVTEALERGCIGIAFVMNDPLASYFTFLEVAQRAKEADLLVGCATNGYFTMESAEKLAPYLDFLNIGIKGFDDDAYKLCGGISIEPVLNSISFFCSYGIHIEISCIYKKGYGKNLKSLAKWLAELSTDIPLQVMRYIPLEGAIPKLEPVINEAEDMCRELEGILKYVYLFNSPGTEMLNTYCPQCGNMLIRRDFYGPMGAKVIETKFTSEAKCPECNRDIPIRGMEERETFTEKGFKGGYPFTRALEMIQAILIASGVNRLSDVVKVWEKILVESGLDSLHDDIQSVSQYIKTIRKFAGYCGADSRAQSLTMYMEDKINEIREKVECIEDRPRVYYAMGKPLFCLKGERFENQLVTLAGGVSVNKEIKCEGRPGMSISVEELNELNPEVIFISSFLCNKVDDFYLDCIKKGITIDAVYSKKIFTHTYPNWDFGSPRWILGLMNIANILHPQLFKFDIIKEAKKFYREFYNVEFQPEMVNLSFGKPSIEWEWK